MNLRLFECKPELKFVTKIIGKLFVAIDSMSIKLTSFKEGIKKGFKAICGWELFNNMNEYEFKDLLKILSDLNNLNKVIILSQKYSEQKYIELVKILTIISVFKSFIQKPVHQVIEENIINGILNTNKMFLQIFFKYEISKDFITVNNEYDVNEKYAEYLFQYPDGLDFHPQKENLLLEKIGSYEYLFVLIQMQNGKNIRKINPTTYTISKKESYFFHHEIGLFHLNDSKKYFKQRILASKLASVKNCTIYHIQEFLDRSSTFRNEIDTYYKDINFWKRGFEILSRSNYREDDITEYVDYLNFSKYQTQNYSLKGKTYVNILKEIKQWHQDIYNPKYKKIKKYWRDKDDGIIKEINCESTVYYYQQIIDSETLYYEGKDNHHCVYAYLKECINMHVQIWKLSQKNSKTRITIEVRNNTIIQARGKCNMRDYYIDDNVLPIFAKQENFKINL